MGRRKKIRSKLVTFSVAAKHVKTDKMQFWTISLQGNRLPEDKAEWLNMAHEGGFYDITLTRVTTAEKRKEANDLHKADIAREGLRLLDEILAKRAAQSK